MPSIVQEQQLCITNINMVIHCYLSTKFRICQQLAAIPLTVSAGLLFYSFIGTIIVSISGTVAASAAFLIARYFAREPFTSILFGKLLYGLTSVKFVPYMLGSWLGMLPGTWAYVSAGAFGRAIIQEESEIGLPGGNGQLLTLGLGLFK